LSSCRIQKYITVRGLFVLRLIPFGISATVSLFLTLPSFLRFEAHAMDEDLCTFVLAICAMLILIAGTYRVSVAEARTRQVVGACLEDATAVEVGATTITVASRQTVSPLMLVGLFAPRILISESARQVLSNAELEVAVRHEMQHQGSHDNLKKAILNCLPFPGMAKLEKAWQEASERAADNGAVSSRKEALDLAAALIKLTRHFPHKATPLLATGLVSVVESMPVRIERLLAWKEPQAARSGGWPYAVPVVSAVLLVLVAKFGAMLVLVHSITERLVP